VTYYLMVNLINYTGHTELRSKYLLWDIRADWMGRLMYSVLVSGHVFNGASLKSK
jgi:hypothetical protein